MLTNVPYEEYRAAVAEHRASLLTHSDGTISLVVDTALSTDTLDEFFKHAGTTYHTLPDLDTIRQERSRLLSLVADLDALVDDMTKAYQHFLNHTSSSKELPR